MEKNDVTLRAGGVCSRRLRKAMDINKSGVDVVQHVRPHFTDLWEIFGKG
jgi:hypothetical protein